MVVLSHKYSSSSAIYFHFHLQHPSIIHNYFLLELLEVSTLIADDMKNGPTGK